MIYRNNMRKLLAPALLLALVLFGISPFTSSASAPPAAPPTPNSVAGWGYNQFGQMNIPAGLNATAIATGVTHSLALKSDGLIDKINQVIVKLDAGQTSAACNQLNSFINQVTAFINSGALTSSQGQSLIDGANGIKADIGCP